jgi:hypothetical protein
MHEKCPSCGSTKIAAGIPLLDYYGDMGGLAKQASVEIEGHPQAWVFKDSVAGQVLADICGDCGHAEFRVSNFRELYEKYANSKSAAR